MPMPDSGFQWRPNDNSAQTLLRYELEAEKWVNAIGRAKSRTRRGSISKDLYAIGMILQLLILVPLLIVLIVLQGIKAVLKFLREKAERKNRIAEMREKGYPESEISLWLDSPSGRKRPSLLLFDSRGNLWFVWQFVLWFIFIFSFTFVFVAITTSIFNIDNDMKDVYFLIFIGGLSAWFAFLGAGK